MNRTIRETSAKEPSSDGTPLAQRAYDAVRQAVERGDLAPGDRVSEYQVASWLSISRTPAREALQRLEAEGLLAHSRRGGLVVHLMDDHGLDEIFQAREVVEAGLARLAANNGSRPQLSSILRLCETVPEIADDPQRLRQCFREFHALIGEAAHNRYLVKQSTSMQELIAADDGGTTLADPERRKALVAEFRAIAEAIAARRADEAAEAAAAHVRAGLAARMKLRGAKAQEER